jgi:hypothetical protein
MPVTNRGRGRVICGVILSHGYDGIQSGRLAKRIECLLEVGG